MGIPEELRDGIVKSSSVVEIWPENARAFEVFNAMGTQWRMGMGGATGLDYVALRQVMEWLQVPPADWRDVFESIQVMESEALKVFSEKHGKR